MKIAIQGDPIRWRDIKKALIGIGAADCPTKTCDNSKFIYFLGGWDDKTICSDDLTLRKKKDYIIYTIEEFKIEFPHKIGDRVFWCEQPYTITGLSYYEGRICYDGYIYMGDLWAYPECITAYPRTINKQSPERKLEKLKYDDIENFPNYSKPALPPNVKIDSDETIHIHIPKGYKVEMEFGEDEIILKKIQMK